MFNRDNSEITVANINRVNNIFMECKTMEESMAIHNLFGAIVFKFLMITKKVTHYILVYHQPFLHDRFHQ